jgi:hypothetical protein
MTGEGSEQAGAATRPASIIWYERLALAAVVASLASAAADRATLAKYYSQYPIFYPIEIACAFAVQLLWIWLIARKRRNWARWISLIGTAVAIPRAILEFDERVRHNAAAAIAQYVVFVILTVAVSLLLRRDARAWFARRPVAPDTGPPRASK